LCSTIRGSGAMGAAGCGKCNHSIGADDYSPRVVEALKTTEDSPADPKFWLSSGTFNFDKTTEDSYGVSHFTGSNKDIRPLLDYTYHKKYSDNRMTFQDGLIDELCDKGKQQDDLLLPWVIFTAGAMGAGKGYVMSWMEKQGCIPLDQFVVVDPDQIRQRLPEWDGYVAKDSMTAAVKTQKEAGMMAEVLGYKALSERWNVIFDGSLRDVEWYKLYFQKLRHSFPGIRIMILHIQADREEVLARAEKRGKETGRMVPRELLESSLKTVPRSVHTLAPYVDVAIKVMNRDGKEPEMVKEENGRNPPSCRNSTKSMIEYLSMLWKPIDTDGDGCLSKEEVIAGLAQGLFTQEVIDSVDTDHDGKTTKKELLAAKAAAHKAAELKFA